MKFLELQFVIKRLTCYFFYYSLIIELVVMKLIKLRLSEFLKSILKCSQVSQLTI